MSDPRVGLDSSSPDIRRRRSTERDKDRMLPKDLDPGTARAVGLKAQREAQEVLSDPRFHPGNVQRTMQQNRLNFAREFGGMDILPQNGRGGGGNNTYGLNPQAFGRWRQNGTLNQIIDNPQGVLSDKIFMSHEGVTPATVAGVRSYHYSGGPSPSQQHINQGRQDVHNIVAGLFNSNKYTEQDLRNSLQQIHSGYYSQSDIDKAVSEIVGLKTSQQQPASTPTTAPTTPTTTPTSSPTTPTSNPANTPTSATPSTPTSSSSTIGQFVDGVLNFFGVGKQPSTPPQGKGGGTTPAPSTATPAPSTTTPAPGTATPAPGTTTPAPGTTTPAPTATTTPPAPTTPSSPLLRDFGTGGIGGGGTVSGPGTFGPGGGGSPATRTTTTPAPGTGGGTGSGFIDSANALLQAALGIMNLGVGNNNPFFNMAKLLAAKSIVEVAKTLIEAGMTDEVVNESPMLKHKALLADQKASGLRGLFETWFQYWNQAAQANKQISKDGQGLAPRA